MGITLFNNGGGISVRWAHYISIQGDAGMGVALSHETGNQATIVFQIFFSDLAKFAQDMLGVYDFNTVTGRLERSLPCQHPYLTWLYASKIVNVQFRKWDGKAPAAGFLPAYSTYDHLLVTVLFSSPRFPMLSDASLFNNYGGAEWNRWTTIDGNDAGEVISRPGSTFKYVEGPQIGQEVQVPIAQFLSKRELKVIWHDLPRAGVYSNNGQNWTCPNQAAGKGCVNQFDFAGFKAGTLLLRGYTIREHEVPYAANLPGLGIAAPSLGADLIFDMAEFDPPLNLVNSPTGVHGHNLAPVPGQAGWCLISSDGTVGGARLFQQYDFSQLFMLNL